MLIDEDICVFNGVRIPRLYLIQDVIVRNIGKSLCHRGRVLQILAECFCLTGRVKKCRGMKRTVYGTKFDLKDELSRILNQFVSSFVLVNSYGYITEQEEPDQIRVDPFGASFVRCLRLPLQIRRWHNCWKRSRGRRREWSSSNAKPNCILSRFFAQARRGFGKTMYVPY